MRYIFRDGTIGLAVLACILYAASATAQTAQTLTLDALHAIYTNEVAKIETAAGNQKADALRAYSLSLTRLSETLKKKGDVDGFAVVEQERRRFRSDKCVATNASNPFVAAAVSQYRQRVATAEDQADRMRVVLLRMHLKTLGELTKTLMARGTVEEIRAVSEEKRAAMAAFAEIAKRHPRPSSSSAGVADKGTGSLSAGAGAAEKR